MQIIDINDMARTPQSVAPDPGYPGFVKIQYKRYFEWMSFDEFSTKNPGLKHLLDNAPKPPADVVGIVSGATKNTLTDKNQNWKKDAYIGMTTWISRGVGEGQKRTVIKNSKITLTVDQDWDTKPNATSQYVITAHVQDSVHAMGNTLPQEDMKALEKKAIQMDKDHGRLSSESLNKNIKYLKPEEI